MELHVAFETLGAGVVLSRFNVEPKVNYLTLRSAAIDLHRSRDNLSQFAGAARVVAVTTVNRRNGVTACRQG